LFSTWEPGRRQGETEIGRERKRGGNEQRGIGRQERREVIGGERKRDRDREREREREIGVVWTGEGRERMGQQQGVFSKGMLARTHYLQLGPTS
jgi:hypothetical protein